MLPALLHQDGHASEYSAAWCAGIVDFQGGELSGVLPTLSPRRELVRPRRSLGRARPAWCDSLRRRTSPVSHRHECSNLRRLGQSALGPMHREVEPVDGRDSEDIAFPPSLW